MSAEEFRDALKARRDEWATNSNSTEDKSRMLDLADIFISQMDGLLEEAGAHPDPPPPRVRAGS